MRPDEILRKLKKKFGTEVEVTQEGKGSHRTVFFRGKRTILQRNKDFGPGRIKEWLKQLGLTLEDLE